MDSGRGAAHGRRAKSRLYWRRMDILLSKRQEAFIEAAVRSGRYASAAEVLRDALRLLEDKQERLAALRSAVEQGRASGPPTPLDADAVKALGRRALNRHDQPPQR